MKGWRDLAASLGLLVMRVAFGVGLATHGYSKLFGGGIEGFAKNAVEPLGFPFPLVFAYLAGAAEFFGALFIAVGLLTRLAAIPVAFNMGVALFMVHVKNGHSFSQMEMAVLYLAFAVTVLCTGAGSFSLDRIILGKKK